MFLLVPAHPGFPGQIPQSRKTVVCVTSQADETFHRTVSRSIKHIPVWVQSVLKPEVIQATKLSFMFILPVLATVCSVSLQVII